MMRVTQIDGLFEIDLSNTNISTVETNNWFNNEIVANYSLPEELPYSIHSFFLDYQSDNTEDYELEFEVNDEEKGLKQFEELCQTYHLQYKGNCASKIVRVLSTLKAGL